MNPKILQLKKPGTATAFQFFQAARYVALMAGSICLAKAGISQQDIGIYQTILLMSGSLSFFWINGFLTTFLRSYAREENKNAVLSASLCIIFSTLFISFFVLYAFEPVITESFHTDNSHFSLFIVFFLFNSVGFITEYILLAKNRTTGLILLGLFHLIIQTLAIALPAFTTADIEDVILGLIVFSSIKFTILVFLILEARPVDVYFSEIKRQLKMALPLILSFFLGGSSIYVDGFIVNHYYDKDTFAMFQYGAMEFPLSALLANALSVAMLQRVTADSISGMAELKARSLKLMHILFPMSIVLLAGSRYLYPLIFNEQFAESAVYFNIYLLLLLSRIIFPQTIITAMGKSGFLLAVSAAEFVINLTASLLLLHFMGLPGVAAGTVVAYLFEKLIYILYLKKKGIATTQYIPVRNYLIYSAVLISVFIIFTL